MDKNIKTKKKRKVAITPQRDMFLSFYNDPKSDTFGNAYRSAIKAKFSKTYATNIASRGLEWVLEGVRHDMLAKAERNLDKVLDLDTETNLRFIPDKKGKKKLVKYHDPQLLRIKNDTSQFIAERIGKDHYSTRSEVTGKDGKPLFDEETKAKSKKAINEFITGNTG